MRRFVAAVLTSALCAPPLPVLASPPIRPKATPTRPPVEEILDVPSRTEIQSMLGRGERTSALAALRKIRAGAASSGDAKQWLLTLIEEVRTRTSGWAPGDDKTYRPRLEEAIALVDAAERMPAVELRIARLLLAAELHERAANAASNDGAGTIQEREPAARTHTKAADDAFEAIYSLRSELGLKPREALVYSYKGGTARDAVTRLHAAHLGRRALLEEASPSGARRPDPKALVGAYPGGAPRGAPPLVRLAALLDDLERWHAAGGRRGEALEARLERARALFAALPDPESRKVVVDDLEKRLAASRDLPAWSSGMAQLALLVNETADAPEKPLAIADAGRSANAGTPGAARCEAIARVLRLEIDDPELTLGALRTAAPGGPLILARHRGAATIRFRASRLPTADVDDDRWKSFFVSRRVRERPASDPAAIEWTSTLPAPRDRASVETELAAPLPRGHLYRVEATLSSSFDESTRSFVVLVTDLVLVVSGGDETLHVRAFSATSGEPVPGATVRLFTRPPQGQDSREIAKGTTARDGLVVFPRPSGTEYLAVTARHGEDVAHVTVPSIQRATPEPPAKELVLATVDRNVAEPGDELRYRIHRFVLLPGGVSAPLALFVRDGKGALLMTERLKLNGLGTAVGRLRLPELPTAERYWRLEVDAESAAPGAPPSPAPGSASAALPKPTRTPLAAASVARAQPERELWVELDATGPAVSGAAYRVAATALARGKPLPNAPVSWVLQGTSMSAPSRRTTARTYPVSSTIASGETTSDPAGRFQISVPIPKVPNPSRGYILELTLRGAGGASEAFSKGVWAYQGPVGFEVRGRTVLRAGESLSLTLLRYQSGVLRAARPGTGVVRLLRVSATTPGAPIAVPTVPPFDSSSYSWGIARQLPATQDLLARIEPTEEVRRQEVHYDVSGRARVSLDGLAPGLYRFEADGAGAPAPERPFTPLVSRPVIVHGPGVRLPVALGLVEETPDSGDRRVHVSRGTGTGPIVVEIHRQGSPFESRLVTERGAVVELPADGGPASVRAVALRDGHVLSLTREVEAAPPAGPRVSLAGAPPSLSAVVTAAGGAPVSDAEVLVQAIDGERYLPPLDPRPRRTSWAGQTLTSVNDLAGGATLRPPSASEWGRLSVPELPAERSILHEEHGGWICGTGMELTRPALPTLSGSNRWVARRAAVSLEYPAAPRNFHLLFEPRLATGVDGRVPIRLAIPPGRAARIGVAAIAPDGRVGYFETVLDTPAAGRVPE